MRNKSSNLANNLGARLNAKISNTTDTIINQGITQQKRTPLDFRNGWLNYGMTQMLNISNNNYASFGTGSENTTTGP